LCFPATSQLASPVIEKVYEFNEAPAALKDLESAQHVGKLVVRVN
jgi:NADPH:quinone reductase-like Zn-dependent oxidoreductase